MTEKESHPVKARKSGLGMDEYPSQESVGTRADHCGQESVGTRADGRGQESVGTRADDCRQESRKAPAISRGRESGHSGRRKPRSRRKRARDGGAIGKVLIIFALVLIAAGLLAGGFYFVRPYAENGNPRLPLETRIEIIPETMEER